MPLPDGESEAGRERPPGSRVVKRPNKARPGERTGELCKGGFQRGRGAGCKNRFPRGWGRPWLHQGPGL